MSGHRTDASACSSSLGTPTAAMSVRSKRFSSKAPTPAEFAQIVSLLPTPTAQAAKHTTDDRGPGTLDDHNLWAVATRLLPTPAAHEPGGTAEQYHARLRAHDGWEPTFLPLSMAVQLLPTPRASAAMANESSDTIAARLETKPYKARLEEAVALLPTPPARLGRENGGSAQAKRYTNPERSNDLDDAIAWTLDLSPRQSPDGGVSWVEPPLNLSMTGDD